MDTKTVEIIADPENNAEEWWGNVREAVDRGECPDIVFGRWLSSYPIGGYAATATQAEELIEWCASVAGWDVDPETDPLIVTVDDAADDD